MKNSAKAKSKPISVQEIQAATDELKKLQTKMKFLVVLPPEELDDYRTIRVGPSSLRQLEQRLLEAREHRELLPLTFDMNSFEHDAELTRGLIDCLACLETLRTALKHTLLVVGSGSVQAGLVAHGHIKVALGPGQKLKLTVNKISHRTGRTRAAAPAEVTASSATGAAGTPEVKASTTPGPASAPTSAPAPGNVAAIPTGADSKSKAA